MRNEILYIAAIVLCCACSRKESFFPKDIAPADIRIERFDSALLSLTDDTAHIDAGIRRLWQEYPTFMPVFVEDILGVMAEDTNYLKEALPAFLNDTMYGFKATNAHEKELFSTIDDIRKPINKAFGRLHYLYPEWEEPTIWLFVSGFNASLFFVGDDIAVGADMYLGSDYEFYNRVVYDYQKFTMRKECIPGDIVSAWLFRNIPYTSEKTRLLDQMIYRGKIMYLASMLLPDEKPWETMGYSKEKWQWCVDHEQAIWSLMMDKQDLYKTETIVLTSYLNDGPFTSEISQDAPARLGTWVGWRIVKSYMKQHPETTIQELMADGDAQKILTESKYRP